MCDRITYCDVIDHCEDCPKYGDDCDGDKMVDDIISRTEAIAVMTKALEQIEETEGIAIVDKVAYRTLEDYAEEAFSIAPSADAEGSLKSIKRQIDGHWYLDAPSAEAVQGWIPCSERLPEESGTYLTTTVKGSVCTDHFYANSNDICGRHWSYHRRREPIAWMPLPKPYKGGDE